MTAPVWRKSSHSDASGNECIEVADLNRNVALRDSKNPDTGHLSISPHEFAHLIQKIKRGTPRT